MKNSNLLVFLLTILGTGLALNTSNILIILGGIIVLIGFIVAVMNDVEDYNKTKKAELTEVENEVL
jgi:disulfide bond formation protein DsbB